MKILKYYLSISLILFIATSCQKHDMEFSGQVVIDPNTQAAFILHHSVPLIDNDTNYIRMVKLNDETIYRSDIVTFNAAPSGSAGRFFLAPKGKSNLKLYLGRGSYPDTQYELVHNKDINLEAGQYYNVFIHDFDTEAVVINNNYPYAINPDLSVRDSCTYVKFYNLMYDSVGHPTTLRLQYKYQNHFNTAEWLPVGPPVAFGESTGWETLKMQRLAGINSGSRTVYYRIYLIDAAGNETGRLQRMNSAGNYVDYSDYWTAYVGRRVHHIFGGYRNDKTIRADVRLFYAQ